MFGLISSLGEWARGSEPRDSLAGSGRIRRRSSAAAVTPVAPLTAPFEPRVPDCSDMTVDAIMAHQVPGAYVPPKPQTRRRSSDAERLRLHRRQSQSETEAHTGTLNSDRALALISAGSASSDAAPKPRK